MCPNVVDVDVGFAEVLPLEGPSLVASSGGADTEPISLLTPSESPLVELVAGSPLDDEEAIRVVGEMGPQLAVRRRRAGMVRMVGGLSCQRRDSRWVESQGRRRYGSALNGSAQLCARTAGSLRRPMWRLIQRVASDDPCPTVRQHVVIARHYRPPRVRRSASDTSVPVVVAADTGVSMNARAERWRPGPGRLCSRPPLGGDPFAPDPSPTAPPGPRGHGRRGRDPRKRSGSWLPAGATWISAVHTARPSG